MTAKRPTPNTQHPTSNREPLRYLSLCSGIEAASVAWHGGGEAEGGLGWQPVAFSEIEPFPAAVLAQRWPGVPNLGDMTRFAEWPARCDCQRPRITTPPRECTVGGITLKIHVCDHCGGISIDLLVGGTPCQAFSIAGLRGGMADPRGNLALTFLAIVDRYRPRWVVWENVPGVHSSWSDAQVRAETEELREANRVMREALRALGLDPEAESGLGDFEEVDQTNDFDCFLGGLEELGYGVATRVLDAQYVRVESHPRAVPQRRRRVFVVGYLGDWRRAAAVLFERESLCGDPPPGRRSGQGPAGTLGTSFARRGYDDRGDTGRVNPVAESVLCGEIVPQAMSSKWSKGSSGPAGDECANLVAHSSPAGENPVIGTFQETGHGWWNDDPVAQSLRDASHGGGSHSNIVAHALRGEGFDAGDDGTGRGTPLVATIHLNGTDIQDGGDRANTLSSGNSKTADTVVAFSYKDHGADAGEVAPTLRSMGHNGSHANGGGHVAIAFDTTQITCAANYSAPKAGDPCHPLAAGAHPPAISIQEPAVSENLENGPQGKGFQEGVAYTLEARNKVQAVAFRACGQDGFTRETVAPPVTATDGGGAGVPTVAIQDGRAMEKAQNGAGINDDGSAYTIDQSGAQAIADPRFAVRRVTPRECERLQGFPDDYTAIPGAKDGPRYKALGNSMAVNVMRWIGDRIALVEAEMGARHGANQKPETLNEKPLP